MIDFAADVAAIFADANGMGEAATYTPGGGSATAIRVIPSRPEGQVSFSSTTISGPTAIFLISCADVAAPAEGDTIKFDGTNYTVQGVPERDERRLWWRVETRPA